MKTRYKIIQLIMIVFIIFSILLQAQNKIVEFESNQWEMINAEIVDHLGRKAIQGYAILKDVEFENGIIEYDIAVDGTRSYPGIVFRMQSPDNYENFYIRPHVSNLPTALQYTPHINGVAGWQLYNGEGFTAAAEIQANKWVHVKLEIKNTQARIYYNDMEKPAIVVSDLKHGISKGAIGIKAGKNNKAFYSNFVYKLDNSLQFDPAPKPVQPMGIIKEWEISQSFKFNELEMGKYPYKELLKEVKWQKVKAESKGLLDIARYAQRSRNGEADFVLAKKIIHADKDETRELAFGYSDIVCVFLNGNIVFSANSQYRSRSPMFQGVVGLNDQLYLPFKKGDNEIMIVLYETFGGWGLMGQFVDDVFIDKSLTKLWEKSAHFKVPESVVYDKKRDILYVTNFYSGFNEFISKVKLNGDIEKFKWIEGLVRPTGMFIDNDILYVIDRRNLVKIDIVAGKILNKYPVPGPRFINDVTMDSDCNIYISDNDGSKIYKFTDGSFEIWLEGGKIKEPNGLYVDKDFLIVGNSGDGYLKNVDLKTKGIKTIAFLGEGSNLDGIKPDGKGNYLVSDYNGRIFLVSKKGKIKELLNTTARNQFSADFEYIIDKKMLIVPSLWDNRITTYKLKE